jgi:hypothetical protein
VPNSVEGPSARSFRLASFQIQRSSMRVVTTGGLWREASGPRPQHYQNNLVITEAQLVILLDWG